MQRLPRLLMWTVLGPAIVFATACSSSKETAGDEPQEQVEVGYGAVDREDVTGAVSTVDVEKIREEQPVTTVADMLRGRVSGVVVTEGTTGGISVRIRGRSSIMGSSDPLYVVDGMPVEPDPGGTISFLNPHDIESISVLKDASATAIYGTRGANGVIVIKTKR